MSVLATVKGEQAYEIVAEAARRNTPVVLSHRRASGWETFKSQFLPGTADGGIQVGDPQGATEGDDDGLSEGALLGVSFRRGHRKCMFASVVEDRRRVMSGDGPVDVLLLHPPEIIQMLQRRVYHRTPVPADKKIAVLLRCGLPQATEHGGEQTIGVCRGLLRNISVGGMAVAVDPGTEPGLAIGQTVRSEIHLPVGRPLSLDVNYRHQTIVGNELQLGFQFVGLETSAGGWQAMERLSRLAIQLQHSYR